MSKIQILIFEGLLCFIRNYNVIPDLKEIQKKNKIFLLYRIATFQLCSKQLSGNPETLQCLPVWGLQNYTRRIPTHRAPAKEKAVACSHDPPVSQSARDSQCCPSHPERWLPGFRRLFHWQVGNGSAGRSDLGAKEPRLPGIAECFKAWEHQLFSTRGTKIK